MAPEIAALFFAGIDTTGHTGTWLMYVTHPSGVLLSMKDAGQLLEDLQWLASCSWLSSCKKLSNIITV